MINYEEKLKEFLETVAEQGASDLHLSVARPPTIRKDGRLVPIPKQEILSPADTEGLVLSVLTGEQKSALESDGEVDFSYALRDKARFRVNAYRQSGYLSAAF